MTVVAAVVLLIATLFVLTFRIFIRNKQNRVLFENAELICREIENNDNSYVDLLPLDYFISFVIYKNDSQKIENTNDPLLPKLPVTEGKTRRYFQKDFYSDGDLNILYYTRETSNSYIIQTSIDIDNDASIEMVNQLPLIAAIAFLPILLISFLLSLFISKRTLKPVKEITKTAQGISSTNLETLLPVSKNNDELDELARTFNQLFENLKKDFDREVNFTSDVSHELKTPVAGILGQANLLKRWGKDDPKQLDESLDLILKEAHSMESIINNLLQISKLENGIVKPFITSVNFWSMFSRLKNEFTALFPNVKILFDDKIDLTMQTDMELLHQVLTAVISNSIKYGASEVELTGTGASEKIEIKVIDNGPGFSEEILPHVFERFFRGDKSHNRETGGAGLGLSISKTIVNVLGGTLQAKNCIDHQGAEVIISF